MAKRRSVIRPWHGYAAYCPACGKPVLADDEYIAFESAASVREALNDGWSRGMKTLTEYVRDVCRRDGCPKQPKEHA